MLYYKEFLHPQSNQWVVFIHGAGGSSAVWYKQLKDFKKEFNLLLIDLRGHGKSADLPQDIWNKQYTFEAVTEDIIEVLDHLKTPPAHLMGVSLGTILARQLAELQPHRVKSLIMAGAITRLNVQSRVLVFLGNTFKRVIPYMWLYRLFAFIIMPRRQHEESRNLFVGEAQKLCQKEFIRWFKLTSDINPLLKYFKEKDMGIPTLYVMGDQDVMFLEPVKNLVKEHKNSILTILEKCGHVVNVEQPDQFNQLSMAFIKNQQ
ncbi:Pimeloyl-ACP methyl ester carboxylesterase [Algoriphagus alkaliphilus]|uniref:Pimeloyl-ACP methyl ester carboxylesterase n=1 Tax=Algoriphagus alkaliphilus TaxID=279824 RepID=A0A1G5Z3J7_9BACT|nr:alpha/beta hydrolase [Algoriphagus alkaliphilus]MBA4302227.1 alpha/beta hydrolase [Cyclobacterium sp.]SDA89448.1 Pimeloyl-ACP methyl ester carboxylesterase [Algoriphagus alkaliphilus]